MASQGWESGARFGRPVFVVRRRGLKGILDELGREIEPAEQFVVAVAGALVEGLALGLVAPAEFAQSPLISAFALALGTASDVLLFAGGIGVQVLTGDSPGWRVSESFAVAEGVAALAVIVAALSATFVPRWVRSGYLVTWLAAALALTVLLGVIVG